MDERTRNVVKDAVNPDHYKVGGLQVVEIWKAKLTTEELRGAYKANILKYIMRAKYKNGVEDYKKAAKYLEWLIESYEDCGDTEEEQKDRNV